MDVIPFGISPVAITTLVSAFGAPAVSHFAASMIPQLGIPYEGEILMAAAGVGVVFMLKTVKGWARVLAVIALGVLFTVGLTRSQVIGQLGGT